MQRGEEGGRAGVHAQAGPAQVEQPRQPPCRSRPAPRVLAHQVSARRAAGRAGGDVDTDAAPCAVGAGEPVGPRPGVSGALQGLPRAARQQAFTGVQGGRARGVEAEQGEQAGVELPCAVRETVPSPRGRGRGGVLSQGVAPEGVQIAGVRETALHSHDSARLGAAGTGAGRRFAVRRRGRRRRAGPRRRSGRRCGGAAQQGHGVLALQGAAFEPRQDLAGVHHRVPFVSGGTGRQQGSRLVDAEHLVAHGVQQGVQVDLHGPRRVRGARRRIDWPGRRGGTDSATGTGTGPGAGTGPVVRVSVTRAVTCAAMAARSGWS